MKPSVAGRAGSFRPRSRRRGTVVAIALMSAIAYIPALLSSPGRMPADTKLFLYLDPRRLVSDSIWSFDGRQFAGWVPHQVIAYLWPSGPWYVAAQALGLPDWVAHRLWIGTIMFAAGAGVAWAARRRLGLSLPSAVAAGLVYQLSPYLVPYISRTSSMLLPWAGLGWVIGLTIGAATRTRWRDAALCALVVASTGSVNATALAMMAPAPVLWLVIAVAERTIPVRRAGVAAVRIGVLSIGTSLWWIVMLSIQGRQGADILAYSESLEDVSLTAASSEVWRGLGYWLTYVRDPFGPATSAGADYMTATGNVLARPVTLGFVLVIVALGGLVFTRFAARRYAVALTFTGVILAVGVHPFAHPSPIARFLAGDGESGLALALRSSTRALPVLTIGLALGAGALVDAVGRVRPSLRLVSAGFVVLFALGNLPSLVGHRLVDPMLERDQQPPAAWYDAADALDRAPAGYRVLQVPGAEFGAFRWGYTVDPPLPALSTRPLATRDLLPLGSDGAMDVLYALDDRFQAGWPEMASVAPIARLFGADTVWVAGDMAFDRFRTPRPEITRDRFAIAADDPANALGPSVDYGEPFVNIPHVPMVDEDALSNPAVLTPVAPVELVPVADPVPIVRASDRVVLVSGSGDGLVDLAAAGLLEGDEVIRYSASSPNDELGDAADQADTIVVTDSNRLRAHHWRSSQDVTGYTETGIGPPTLWADSGDARLDVFPNASLDTHTRSVQDGPLAAVATWYGEPFVYRPEARAAMAIDGDPDTAWTVLDPRDQYLDITTDRSVEQVTLVQPSSGLDGRRLATVRIRVDDREPFTVRLDERSLLAGQAITFPATDGPTRVRIGLGDVVGGSSGPYPDRTPVGIAEADFKIGMSPEIIRTPTDLTDAMREDGIDRPVTYVLTRERVSATNRWRRDPEARLVRDVDVPFAQDVSVDATVRLDLRAGDQLLAGLLGIDGPTSSARLVGVPTAAGWAAADGDSDTAWITPFGHVDGAFLDVQLIDPDSPVTLQQRGGNYSRVTALRLSQGSTTTDVALGAPDADGRSAFDVPDGIMAGPLRMEIIASNSSTTVDRRYGDPVLMPAAITELTNIEPAVVPASFDTGCRDDLVSVDGAPVPVRVSGTVTDAFAGDPLDVERCDPEAMGLDAGTHRLTGDNERRSGLHVDRIVLTPVEASGDASAGRSSGRPVPAATVTEQDRLHRTVTVDDCPDGCWLVLGEGFHEAWSASTGHGSLGHPQLVDGGFNGWWIPAHDGPAVVRITWTAQGPLDAALAISLAAVVMTAVIAWADRSRRTVPATPLPRWASRRRTDRLMLCAGAGLAWTLGAAMFVTPGYALWGLLGGVGLMITRRIRLAGVVAIGALAYIAFEVVNTVRTDHPDPTPRFPGLFEHLHHLGAFAAVALAVSALAGLGARHHSDAPSPADS